MIMRTMLLISGLIFLFSCNNQSSDKDVAADTTFITVDSPGTSVENPGLIKNLIWTQVFDSSKGDMILKKQRQVNSDTLSVDKLIHEINSSWDGIKLEFRKISHDTIYVAIPESNVLTNQMGSTGADSYMSSTTFILTELKDVKYVNYDFAEGDHMQPGTRKRADFKF